jgi:hypothetical protein
VQPGATQAVLLTATLTRDDMTKTEDATRDDNVGGFTQQFVAEATGRLLLTPKDTTQPVLRVPYGISARPASTMTSAGSLTFPVGSTEQPLALQGTGVSTGPAGKSCRPARRIPSPRIRAPPAASSSPRSARRISRTSASRRRFPPMA